MVRMGTVWDRTTAFLGDRAGALMPIAVLLIFVPMCLLGVLMEVLEADPEPRPLPLIAALVIGFVVFWGQLSIMMAVIEPTAGASAATALAGRRLLPAIGVRILVGLIFLVLALPVGIAIAASGGHPSATGMGYTFSAEGLSPGIGLFVLVYMLVYVAVLVWGVARLLTLDPVVVAERRGARAIGRAFGLTRGLALKIVGVLILFWIVFAVSRMAVTTVLGSVFRLLFDGEGAITAATVLTAIAGGAVTTIFTVLAAAFTAELYLAARAFRDTPVEAE